MNTKFFTTFGFAGLLSSVSASLLSASLLTGCLNNHITPLTSASTQRNFSSTGDFSSSTDLNSDYICTGKENIHPKYDYNFNGTYQFEVCTHRTTTSKILVKAPGMEDIDLCVLPAQYYSDTKIVMKPGADLLPIYDHGVAGDHGLRLEFKNTNFNAAVIVACTSITEMRSCLYANYLQGCPRDWSYGKFRD